MAIATVTAEMVYLKSENKGRTYRILIHQSVDDWDAAELLFCGKKYLQALFFAHLSLEKVCKAHWIRTKESNISPKTHNLIFLISNTAIELTNEQKEFLLELNRFQIEGRYPEQISRLYKITTHTFAEEKLAQAKKQQEWLLNKLQ